MKIELQIDASRVLKVLFALLFLWAGLSKLPDPHSFQAALAGYRLGLPPGVLKLVAITLPWVEILTGLAILTGVWRTATASLLVLFFALFVLLTGIAAIRGLDIACGCFNLSLIGITPGSPTAAWLESAGFAFARNLALLALSLWFYRLVDRDREDFALAQTTKNA